MHPAVADCSLHISAIPGQPSANATPGKIPVSLGALAAPGRRNALARAPWAGSASHSGAARSGRGSVTGDMTVVESVAPGYGPGGQNRLCFRGLVSRAVASPSGSRAASPDTPQSKARLNPQPKP